MAKPLSKDMGKEIPVTQGKEWIKRYQDQNPDSLKAVFYGSNILDALLMQKDCVGIRIYNAIADDGSSTFVLVAAKENGNNIWLSKSEDSTPDGIVAEFGSSCPSNCADND
jgi:hypothetical protein